MMIKPFIYLLVIDSIFIMGANLLYGEEAFVFYDRQAVFVLSTSPDGGQIKKKLMDDAYLFAINSNGYFTVMDGVGTNRTWSKGRIDSSFRITKQVLSSIPPDVTSVAISEDGKRVAWKTGESYLKSELTIEEYNGSESKVLRKISVDGMIPNFSWSPNSDLLAYYWGQPEASTQDGFSLMLLDMKNPEKPPVEIAPSSLNPGYTNPDRATPPLWSPTGEFILFEARYKTQSSTETRYIVSVDGRTLVPSQSGIWGQDGRHIRELELIGSWGSGEYIVAETDILSKKEKTYSGNKLKINATPDNIRLSPSGRKIAYVANHEIFVYDTMEKSTVSYGTSQDTFFNAIKGVEFFWITPKD